MRATLRTYSTRNRDGVSGSAVGTEDTGERDPRGELTEEELSLERERMIEDRQSELARVLDRHDDLMREDFHLRHFKLMIKYDPKEVKNENTEVFLKHKAAHDLLDSAATSDTSRKTRQARTARAQALQVNSVSTSAPPARSTSTAANHDDDPFGKLISNAKSKRKGSGKAQPDDPPLESISAAPAYGRKGRTKAIMQDALEVSTPESEGASSSGPHARKKSVMGPPSTLPTPRKKRKLHTAIEELGEAASVPDHGGGGAHPQPISDRLRTLRTSIRSHKSVAEAIAALPPTPSSPSLKRIKLIVHGPHPTLSNPLQKPPPPKFGESLTAFLSSYSAPEDLDLDEHGLHALIQDDLRVWRQIDAMRRQGRMLYRPPDDDVGNARALSAQTRVDTRQPDTWDVVLDAVRQRAEAPRACGENIVAQIVACVQGYWDAQAVREDKARMLEERRLKALAKATIRMVTAEWKKAVFHIREQERLKREEEERRRGHEHLDAILDQSGQLLEAQQVDMTKGDLVSSRSRSRSSSLADTLGRWASATPPPEGAESDGGTEIEESEDSASESGSDSKDELDSRFLVAGSKDVSETPGSADEETGGVSGEGTAPSPRTRDPDDPDEDGASVPSETMTTESLELALSYPSDDNINAENILNSVPSLPNQVSSKEKTPLIQADPPLSETNGRLVAIADNCDSRPNPSSDRLSPILEAPPPASPSPPATQTTTIHDGASDAPPPDTPMTESEAALDTGTTTDAQETYTPPEMDEDETEEHASIPAYLRPYAVAPMEWDPQEKVKPPLLLRGNLRPYQHAGLEWLASLHTNNVNGILADEMGLGKTIQTISLLAHLACDRGIWGPHLIIVPTSVLLNWEMEFKKFLPGFKVLSYHGNTKRRKELRQGWNNKYHFNVCVTSYTLASRDAHVFKRKPWYYMILDEAHMIKNFKSQRWNILLMFRSFRRLLLTGTPLQNNLTELWALLQFLMSGTNFANLKEFGDWFANPLEKAIEMGIALDEEMQQRVSKLHSVLRPYLLRRLKRDVEKELPSKFEHLVLCPLSKRQRFLYDEFMSRAATRHDLQSGVYQKIANILMQLRKVVNHPDLFEVRPIKTSFAMSRSAIADYEIKELLVRRELLRKDDEQKINMEFMGLVWIHREGESYGATSDRRYFNATRQVPGIYEIPDPPPRDVRTIAGYRAHKAYMEQVAFSERWRHIYYVNHRRCHQNDPAVCEEIIYLAKQLYQPLLPYSALDCRVGYLETCDRVHKAVKSYSERTDEMADIVDRFAFATPSVVALDLPRIALSGQENAVTQYASDLSFDAVLHRSTVKLQIAFPDPSLLQYDCGKLQELGRLLRERKAGGHRILIFTQMTRILDILEIFLNLHGYLYLRLDGATKIEDRQYITERFNTDPRIFCFISSSRSGGVGINLTGADTVIFYDSDFNPQMDRQCEDRAHRIGQIRDVHIYRFISSHTVEEALLRKANQKRSLDDIVIQKGEFDWRTLFGDDGTGISASSGLGVGTVGDSGGLSVSALERALGEFEDSEDRVAREVAALEEVELTGADEADFDDDSKGRKGVTIAIEDEHDPEDAQMTDLQDVQGAEEEDGGTTVEYMLSFIQFDMEFFSEWRV